MILLLVVLPGLLQAGLGHSCLFVDPVRFIICPLSLDLFYVVASIKVRSPNCLVLMNLYPLFSLGSLSCFKYLCWFLYFCVCCKVSLFFFPPTGMYFQIRDFVLSCPECQSQRSKKSEVREDSWDGRPLRPFSSCHTFNFLRVFTSA